MKRKLPWILMLILCFVGLFYVTKPGDETSLWPTIEPYQVDYLKVSNLHELYYEISGNPKGIPVFVLHGGPGGTCNPDMRRFFNPEKFMIVMHDQRGAGRSKPYAEIRENTTQDLVEDIETLRKHVDVEKMILFGGSWGSTLALAYAETYPKHVSGMVLRGVFTATQEEIDHFYHGGLRPFFPEVYDKLINALPDPEARPIPDVLFDLISSEDPFTREKYAKLWAWYEFKVSELIVDNDWVVSFFDSDKVLDKIYAFSLIENYYMKNHCFLEEGQLLRNAYKIRQIPTILATGRYDMICPPINAKKLDEQLLNCQLRIVEGSGHWLGDKPMEKTLVEAMKAFEK